MRMREEIWKRGVEGYQNVGSGFRFESCREINVLEKPIWRLKMPSVIPWL